MEKMLDQLQIEGLVEAQLLIEERSKIKKGKKSRFVVPVILVSTSAQGALESPGTRALLAGEPVLELPLPGMGANSVTDENDPVDAQVVDIPGYDRDLMDARLATAIELIAQMYEYTLPDLITAFALGGSSGNTNVLPALSDSEHQKALRVAEQVAQGKRKITAISNGRIVLG
jgi:hypothetical protein